MKDVQLALFIVNVLDDADGISPEAYDALFKFARTKRYTDDDFDLLLSNVMSRIESHGNRFFLQEDDAHDFRKTLTDGE